VFRESVRLVSSVKVNSKSSTPLSNHVTESDIEAMFDYSAEKSSLADDWRGAMKVIEKSEEIFPSPEVTEEELLKIRASKPTMSLASLVENSLTLQKLVDLGVSLYKWDQRGKISLASKLEFEKDVAPFIRLLVDVGVPLQSIAEILTYNPELLEEETANLQSRLNYLATKGFTAEEISEMISGAPLWLSYPVNLIDARLGFFQKTFELTGKQVRGLAVSSPSLIAWRGTPKQVRKNLFSLNEEMGFSKAELTSMILSCPKLLLYYENKRYLTLEQFELLHNDIGYSHEILSHFPAALLCDVVETRARRDFLQSFGKDQYSPDLPNYINPGMLALVEDKEFAEHVARSSILHFNTFLKTI